MLIVETIAKIRCSSLCDRSAPKATSATADAYVPLSFAPGEAYQFERCHKIVLIAGVAVMAKVAHVRLCHSRMMFMRAYPRETQEMVFDAHDPGFASFKGVCARIVYDNTGRMLAFAE